MKNFQLVKILFFLLITVSLNTQTTNARTVEERPVYIKGGDDGLLRDLYCNLSTVSLSQSDTIKGRCIFTFVISKDGMIDVETIKLVRKTTLPDVYVNAAKEAVKHLGEFKPGKKNGTPVKVWYTLPVIFPIPLDKFNPNE
ncbi:MAG: energy transducer TonB [Duncaniella sp.]|nr:energy transducer TonB [Duncaniella sp.]MDE6581764.1 energy transducer TonB [Duncaniella sp.]